MYQHKSKLSEVRYALLGLMALLLVAFSPAALNATGGGGLSGDDAYDPAAGGLPQLLPAAALTPVTSRVSGGYSGDDAYDSAAGGLPQLLPAAALPQAFTGIPAIYSGDDVYDPATESYDLGDLGVGAVLTENSPSADCGLTAGEIAGRIAVRTPGGFSGDDAYDTAAGGIPELSVAISGGEPGQLAACVPAP
jgi:hypothetical protein